MEIGLFVMQIVPRPVNKSIHILIVLSLYLKNECQVLSDWETGGGLELKLSVREQVQNVDVLAVAPTRILVQ